MSDIINVFCDAETGDLKPVEGDTGGDLLTIYFGFYDENRKLLDELDLKLKPDNRLPIAHAGALRVNKIDLKEHLADPATITYSEASKLLKEKIEKHLKKNGRFSNLIFSGFNCPFDITFVKAFLLSEEEFEDSFHYKYRDIQSDIECLRYYGWIPSEVSKLEKCVEYFGAAKGTAHTARGDIVSTIEVEKKIKELMDSKKSGGQTVDLISLLEAE